MDNNTEKPKFKPADYLPKDKLFIGYRKTDINEGTERLEVNFFRFPDFSCNWSRFSNAVDVRQREKGLPTDGCIYILVDNAQFHKMATPCHDPLQNNYSHTEIRQLTDAEELSFEPPKERKLKSFNWSKTNRQIYRQHLVNTYEVELEAIA